MLPGKRLLAIARLWFDAGVVERVFEPLVADWQWACRDAQTPAEGLRRYAAGLLAFGVTAARCAPLVLLSRPEPGTVPRILFIVAIFALLGTGLNLLLWDGWGNLALYPLDSWPFIAPAFLLSSAMFAALPLALVIRALHRDRRRARIAVMQTTIALFLLFVTIGGWIVPATNQQYRRIVAAARGGKMGAASPQAASTMRKRFVANWRELIGGGLQVPSRSDPPRGTAELTTWELFGSARPTDLYARWDDIVAGRHNRVSLTALPLVLALLGWSVGGLSARAPYLRGLLWWGLACAVFVTIRTGTHMFQVTYGWPEPAVIWLPLALFMVAAVAARPLLGSRA